MLRVRKSEIERLNAAISQAFEDAYSGFAEALRIHDEWEALYIANMNFQAAEELTTEYTQLLYGNQEAGEAKPGRPQVSGGGHSQGRGQFVPNLTDGLKRYFIKGRPGSGKSTLLKKLASVAIERGLDVEIYHCGFDPNSLDMIIVRELGFAMFDSTAPHEYFPDRHTDEIVDMYERCIQPGTDEAHADLIINIKDRYTAKMKESIQYLAQAKSLHDELEQIYVQSMDFLVVDRKKEAILAEITSMAAIGN